ncbi:hypothetical protein L1987_77158 [Smallanthus sonchifolius]|uniref:Uncharacterized protein n=1 Tax=Smallanthus sonchifolius TaxID=185202 RepID=A0ACB8ZA22_9ASTR|nr:hypothetical protein L1987_77158 [Smallanthus sonchifolius]
MASSSCDISLAKQQVLPNLSTVVPLHHFGFLIWIYILLNLPQSQTMVDGAHPSCILEARKTTSALRLVDKY